MLFELTVAYLILSRVNVFLALFIFPEKYNSIVSAKLGYSTHSFFT